jgi:CYTH domain-containing protein
MKYARHEYERRFLLAAPDVPVSAIRTVEIHDLYLSETRIRVRRAETVAGEGAGRAEYKLTQKVPDPNLGPGLITTLYLTLAEYQVLSQLPGSMIRKTRLGLPPLAIDCFRGPLTVLYLAEAEFSSASDLCAYVPPAWVVAEVTGDTRFTGGALAETDVPTLRHWLADYDIAP